MPVGLQKAAGKSSFFYSTPFPANIKNHTSKQLDRKMMK